MSDNLRAGVVSRTEDASGVTGCRFLRFRKCIRWSRRLFSAPLKMRCVPEKTVFGTEYLFRTVEACFLHRMLPKMRRVPQEAFLSTECVFRTVEGRFWYRISLPYQKLLFFTPNASEDASRTVGGRFWYRVPSMSRERGRPFRRPHVSIRPIRHHILNLTLITAGLSLSLSSRPVLSMTYLLSGSVVSLCPYSR